MDNNAIATIALIIGLALIILFIVIGFVFRSFQATATDPIPDFLKQYQTISFWGPNIQGSDSTRNTCHLYNFSGAMTVIDGDLTAVPAQPSLNPAILDNVPPQALKQCYDLDQITAAQVYHVCTTEPELEAGNFAGFDASGQEGVSFCIRDDGSRAPVGSQEIYYTQNSSLFDANGNSTGSISCNTPPCQGILSLMAFNYRPGEQQDIYDMALCMSIQDETTFIGKKCDISDSSQLVRLSRIYPSANTNSTGNGKNPIQTGGKNGSITNIYDRDTGTCVIVNPDDPNSLILDTDCNRYWALSPYLDGTNQISPQQIVWGKDLTSDQIAEFNATLSADKLLALIQENNLTSIQLTDVVEGSPLVVKPFAVFPKLNPPDDERASFQPVTYPLFNQILFTNTPSVF